MKRKILLILFIMNTMMILIYYIPSIGIIGGVDGPTVIYIASQINWFPIIIFSIEIVLGLYILLTRSKK